jgi:hypothetical protein
MERAGGNGFTASARIGRQHWARRLRRMDARSARTGDSAGIGMAVYGGSAANPRACCTLRACAHGGEQEHAS